MAKRELTLHDEEVGVVDIKLNALEKVLHRVLRRPVPANEVLARPIQRDLPTSSAPFLRSRLARKRT